MRNLTIGELKALKVGDWVWVVNLCKHRGTYRRITAGMLGGVYFDKFFDYKQYGRLWLAYKNKEQAEAKGEIIELPCKIGDPIWVVYRDFDHGFNEYKIYESICTGFAFENGTKIRIVTAFCCYDFDRVGNYNDKSEAERRLAELKGEKS